jgi:uncharacterized protein
MFHRRMLEELRVWAAQPSPKPLFLRGARQVGKTSVVELLAQDFEVFIRLDLDIDADAALFRRGLGVEDLLQVIMLHTGKRLVPGRTLLFVDEIQAEPEAIAIMRRFREAFPGLPVIAAGSLLEAVLASESVSFPVGRVEHRFMRPLTFREFLVACGDDVAVEALDAKPFAEASRLPLLERFHRFALVGGMPEVVARYALGRDLSALRPIYQALQVSYSDDVAKYARTPAMAEVLRHAIEAVPREAGTRIKFQGFGQSRYASREMGEALKTLSRVMLIELIYPTTSLSIPITPDRRKSPKLHFFDTGLINFALGLQGHYFSHDDLHGFHRGLLAELLVMHELMAAESGVRRDLHFWVREQKQSSAEIDVVLQHGTRVVPVEVKAGATGALRSLHEFIDRCPHDIAVRLYSGPYRVETTRTPAGKPYRLLNLPYFLASQIPTYLDLMEGEPSFMEDLEDLDAFDERAKEPVMAYDELVDDLKKHGKQ